MPNEKLDAISAMFPGGASEEFKQQMAEIQAKKAAGGGEPAGGGDPAPKSEPAGGGEPAGSSAFKIKVTRPGGNTGNPLVDAMTTKEEEIELKTLDDVLSLFKENGVEDFTSALSLVPTLKEREKRLQELEQKAAELEKLISVLPEPVFAQANAFWNGQDYRHILTKLREFDFTKSVDQVKPQELVSHYFSDEISSDSLEEDSPSFKALYKAAKVKFEADQTKFNDAVKAASDIQANERKRKQDSLQKSVERINSHPILKAIPQDKIKQAQEELVNNMFNDSFFMPDGSFREDALENYLILKNGKDVLSSVQQRAKTEGSSDEAERLAKAAEEQRKKEAVGGAGASDVSDKVKKVLGSMSSLSNGSMFEHVEKQR